MASLEEVRGEEVRITSWEAGMRLCSRMAFKTAPPSLPVVLVRASIFVRPRRLRENNVGNFTVS